MDGDEIGVVLSRASELRSKINNCIQRTSPREDDEDDDSASTEIRISNVELAKANEEQRRWRVSEAESLITIRDAVESLEEQLACLQVLQQHQRREREATLAELDESRRILLKKLKEYRGKELEVIQEACAFAGEPVEQKDDLLLPPYPRRLPVSFTSSVDDDSPPLLSAYSARRRSAAVQHSFWTKDERQDSEEGGHDEKRGDIRPPVNNRHPKKLTNGIGKLISLTTKAVLVLASVISVFTLARLELNLRKRNDPHKISNFLLKKTQHTPTQQVAILANQCPPGKVLMVEDGVPRCFVKERIELPFESVVKDPDISYGFG